ncbi:MAG: nitroreductase family protein, partial [Candidatus Delongbacteria bacterium]|nr:nitroreductase family protein [Candidatus Delongbacteria bacterium]
MNFLELAKKRSSVRSYSDKSVEKEKILRCIEAAGLSPSACNSQPWHF